MSEVQKKSPLRILALPKVSKYNPIIEATYRAIEAEDGFDVDGWTPGRMFFGRYDVLHFHWPDSLLTVRSRVAAYMRATVFLCLLRWFRRRGGRIVWTAHNPGSHECFHRDLEASFWKRFLALVDGIVFLSQATKAHALARWPSLEAIPHLMVPHGSYVGLYPDLVSRVEARASLGIDEGAKVILNLGLIRPYKRLDRLVDLARNDPQLTVVVAGPVHDQKYLNELRARAAGLENFRLVAESIPRERLQLFFKAADLFAVPYDSATNSGSAILALSFGLPVLAPDLPIFRELQETFGRGWVRIVDAGGFGVEAVRATLAYPCPDTIDWNDWDLEAAALSYRTFFSRIGTKVC